MAQNPPYKGHPGYYCQPVYGHVFLAAGTQALPTPIQPQSVYMVAPYGPTISSTVYNVPPMASQMHTPPGPRRTPAASKFIMFQGNPPLPPKKSAKRIPKTHRLEMPNLKELCVAPKKAKNRTPRIEEQERSPLLFGVLTFNEYDSKSAVVPAKQKHSPRHVLIWHPCTAVLVCIDTEKCHFDALHYQEVELKTHRYFTPDDELKFYGLMVNREPFDTWSFSKDFKEEIRNGKIKHYYVPRSCATLAKKPSHTQKIDLDDWYERLPPGDKLFYEVPGFTQGQFYFQK